MKLEQIIIGLKKEHPDYADRKKCAVFHAIKFLEAYQVRVKELEDAFEDAISAKKALTGDYEDSYLSDCINGELLILHSFYDEGENPLEGLAEAGSSLRENTQGMEEKKGRKSNPDFCQHEECIFKYCDNQDICRNQDKCRYGDY